MEGCAWVYFMFACFIFVVYGRLCVSVRASCLCSSYFAVHGRLCVSVCASVLHIRSVRKTFTLILQLTAGCCGKLCHTHVRLPVNSSTCPSVDVEKSLYVHRNRTFIRDRSPGRPPQLSHSSWAMVPAFLYVCLSIPLPLPTHTPSLPLSPPPPPSFAYLLSVSGSQSLCTSFSVGMCEQLLVRLTKQSSSREMYSSIRRHTRNN